MDEKDSGRFGKVVAVLAEDKRAQVSKMRLQILWEELKPYPLVQVEGAARRLMRERKYAGFPSLAEWLDILDPKEEEQDDDGLAVYASHNWGEFLDDPVFKEAIKATGGWNNAEWVAGEGNRFEYAQWHKEFQEAFKYARRKQRRGEKKALEGKAPLALSGLQGE